MEDFGVFSGVAGVPPLPASAIIVSIVENRAREVCLSKISLNTGFHVELYLLQDNHAFTETLALIDGISPNQILLVILTIRSNSFTLTYYFFIQARWL